MNNNATELNSLFPDIFIRGERVCLRIPDIENDIENGNWHSWFNDQDITRYLIHGNYPISREQEVELIRNEATKSSSLILSIIDTTEKCHIGVISLKHIDHINQTAEIGIVMGEKRSPLAAIEAMALLVKHAFDRLNLSLLYAGQHEGLWKWVNTLALIGFRIDGYRQNAGIRDRNAYGIFLTSVSAEDFYQLQEQRNGNVLTLDPMQLLKQRSKQNPVCDLKKTIGDFNSNWRGY